MYKCLKKIYQVVFIITIVFVAISLLSLINCFTHTQLEFQQEETTLKLLQKVFPEVDYYYYDEEIEIYTIFDNNKDEIGYAFVDKGKGYGGTIRILVGLEDENTIKSVSIISHNEVLNTGGEYGNTLDFTPLLRQLVGLKIEDCILDKDGGNIDSISGATISSNAVVNTVRETALGKIKLIKLDGKG
jgi:electron transport complex protein RnfG